MGRAGRLRRLILACVGLVTSSYLAGCGNAVEGVIYSPPGTTTTIYIVRHAERDEGFDPPLNAEGLVRAQSLADRLEDEGVTAIFYPDMIRNRQTAEPLIALVSPTVRTYAVVDMANTKALAQRFVNDVLRDHAGGVVLWIGNNGPVIPGVQEGNLQEIYYLLGGTGEPPLRYTSLYKVTLHEDAPPTIEEGSYGGPSSQG